MRIISLRTAVVALVAAALATTAMVSATPDAEAGNGTTVRPVSDFLDVQTLPGDLVDWISDPSKKDVSYRARVDFLGVIHENYIKPNGGDLGTSFSGTVTERRRTDGRTDVHVVLHGKNVLFFVWNPAVGVLLAGRPAPALILGGLSVDTCSMRYDLKYITPNDPGETMPRLVPLLFDTPEGWEVVQSKITAHGDCELRSGFGVADGTPGRCSMIMNGLIHPKGGDVTQDDTFPVGNIKLRVVGQ